MAKCLLRRGGLVLLKTSACCGLPIFLKANHQLESRVPEIGLLGSEGGATSSVVPTPIMTLHRSRGSVTLSKCPNSRRPGGTLECGHRASKREDRMVLFGL